MHHCWIKVFIYFNNNKIRIEVNPNFWMIVYIMQLSVSALIMKHYGLRQLVSIEAGISLIALKCIKDDTYFFKKGLFKSLLVAIHASLPRQLHNTTSVERQELLHKRCFLWEHSLFTFIFSAGIVLPMHFCPPPSHSRLTIISNHINNSKAWKWCCLVRFLFGNTSSPDRFGHCSGSRGLSAPLMWLLSSTL